MNQPKIDENRKPDLAFGSKAFPSPILASQIPSLFSYPPVEWYDEKHEAGFPAS